MCVAFCVLTAHLFGFYFGLLLVIIKKDLLRSPTVFFLTLKMGLSESGVVLSTHLAAKFVPKRRICDLDQLLDALRSGLCSSFRISLVRHTYSLVASFFEHIINE